MSEKIELVTPLYNFLNNPTSSTYLSALEYLSKKDTKISDDEIASLNLFNTESVVLDNELGFFIFNEKYWNVLDKLDLSIDWEKYLIIIEEKKKTKKNNNLEQSQDIEGSKKPEPIPEELKQLISNCIKEDITQASDTECLHYFKGINDLLKESEDFKVIKKYSIEVSKYLQELNEENKSFDENKKPLLNEELWLWVYKTTCRIYELYLIENKKILINENEESKKIINKAIELSLFTSYIFLHQIFQHSPNFTFGIYNYCYQKIIQNTLIKENVKFKNILEPLVLITPNKDNPDLSFEENDAFINILATRNSFVKFLFALLEPINLVPKSTIDVFVNSYTANSTDVYWELDNQIIFVIFEGLFDSITESGNATLVKLFDLKDIYNKQILEKIKSKYSRIGISTKALGNFLTSNCSGYWQENYERELINYNLGKLFVDRCNKYFEKNGKPLKLKFNKYFYGLSSPLSPFYESVSTLAIVFNDEEWRDCNFFNSYPTERFVKAALALHNAGLSDHALVTLGYGLVRLCLGYISFQEKDFSISEVNSFITKPEIWPRVEKLFLPFLNLCLQAEDSLSYGTKIWIKNIQSRFNRAELHVLEFNTEKLQEHIDNKFELPGWFNQDDELLIKNLMEIRSLSNRTKDMSTVHWRQFFISRNLRGKLNEIVQSLEQVSLDLFKPLYMLIQQNNEFKQAILKLNSNLKLDKLELGFIEFLIRNIIDASKKNHSLVKGVIDTANKNNKEIGKVLYKIQHSDINILNSFQYFRNLDNSLSHKGASSQGMLSQSDTNWIYTYATTDFKGISDLFN